MPFYFGLASARISFLSQRMITRPNSRRRDSLNKLDSQDSD